MMAKNQNAPALPIAVWNGTKNWVTKNANVQLNAPKYMTVNKLQISMKFKTWMYWSHFFEVKSAPSTVKMYSNVISSILRSQSFPLWRKFGLLNLTRFQAVTFKKYYIDFSSNKWSQCNKPNIEGYYLPDPRPKI